MVIRLLSIQIVHYWSIIKYALQQVEKIGSEESLSMFNRLFASLLSDKNQCFLMYGGEDNKVVKAVMITEISEDLFLKVKSLRIRCLYAFESVETPMWDNGFKLITELAKREGCKNITFETANPRIQELSLRFGARKKYTTMEIPLGV